RAVRRARADSARVASRTEVEHLATGKPMPRLVVDTPRAVPRRLSGSLYAAGTVSGNLQRFDLRGRLIGDSLDVHGNAARHIRAAYAWTNARTPAATLAAAVQGDSISASGFALDSIDARVSYRAPGGRVEVVVVQAGDRYYGLKGDYALSTSGRQLRIADMQLQLDSTTWQSTHPSVVYWRPSGIEVQNFELRNGATGRIYANGLLPTAGTANFVVAVDNLDVGNVLDAVQSDIPLRGFATVHGRLVGTLTSPTFRGAFGLVDGTYNGTDVPGLHGTFDYAAERLVTHAEALREGGAPMMVADAQLPLNLALTGVTGPRLLDRPVVLDVVADSMPLDLVPQFTDVLSNVHGAAAGRVAMRGTFQRPSLAGGLVLAHGTMKMNATGMTVSNVYGSVRMLRDTVFVDTLSGESRGPVYVRGTLAVGDWRQPAFNLYLVAHRAEVLNNDRGRLDADAGLRLVGPFTHAYLSGKVQVTGGVAYAPQANGRHVIGNSDPDIFAVVDTSLLSNRDLFPPQSPLLRGLRMDVSVGVSRDTWVRNRDANVEIFTEQPIAVHYENATLALTGAVGTERGEYTFMSKRFIVTRGSAIFVGTPEINPTLQVTGDYQVAVAGSPALDIQVLIGGTLRQPKLSLQSDAQPPRSQSELLSLLAFGRSSSTLLEPTGSSLAGVGGSGNLVGAGAALATKRLTGVALGVLVDQAEAEVGRGIGADQFNITPGDVAEVTNLAGNPNLQGFINDTRIEAGKYLNPRTFLGLQEFGGQMGGRIEYRTPSGFTYSAYTQPRILLLPPRLDAQPNITKSSFGALILRQWKF
ncbi:MAG TPA: translocation/assembly module TamB domain-containing protein, partial [Gemmatimonadaceae bacterium]|nr:translocation/assembly module TamB domain-containing protein [Gemmatimonadaceae bacterium]